MKQNKVINRLSYKLKLKDKIKNKNENKKWYLSVYINNLKSQILMILIYPAIIINNA